MRDSGAYNPVVLDHFRNPRNLGEMKEHSALGHAVNPVCGDEMRLFIRVERETIVDASFLTMGCTGAIAASSMVTELIKGKTIKEAEAVTHCTIEEALEGLPPTKIHCSVLAEDALTEVIRDWKEKSWREERG
jgi:nitrogen fixation NifU-like protein